MKRWLLLENNPALSDPGWLPPPEAWPELAPLREEHERLLNVAREEGAKLASLRKRREDEEAARGETMKAAFLAGSEPDEKEKRAQTRLDLDIREAQLRVEAAADALVTFLEEAMGEIQRRAPEWYATLESRRADAEIKREAARRLLAEADAVVGEADRMRVWLDRESGRSALGHFPYAQMGAPDPAHVESAAAVAAV